MVDKIALEEHFMCPGFIDYWNPTAADLPPHVRERALARLCDFGETRLAAMDRAGITRAVLGLAGPGVQAEPQIATAVSNARAANDFLANEVARRPDRYAGFAHLPMQDAKAAADELERGVRELKFCGAMINGHTNGQYLDHPSLYPFWERAEALARSSICIRPIRWCRPRCWRGTRVCAAPPGNGPSRPDRMRCGSFSAACSTAFPASRSPWGTWARRCRSCFGASPAAPGPNSMRSSSPRAPRNISRTTSW